MRTGGGVTAVGEASGTFSVTGGGAGPGVPSSSGTDSPRLGPKVVTATWSLEFPRPTRPAPIAPRDTTRSGIPNRRTRSMPLSGQSARGRCLSHVAAPRYPQVPVDGHGVLAHR